MDMDTIVEKWFSTREQKITWSISLAFFIIFPVYFANIAAFLPDNAVIGGDGGATGTWDVTFTETDIATSESTETLMDGEELIFEFTFEEVNINLAYVEITVSHGETDESGQWNSQCDNAVGEMRMGQVNEFVRPDSTTSGDSGSANDCPASYTMVIMLIENYTGDAYQTSGAKGAIQDMWSDNGNGRGEYRCQITLETRTGSSPGPSGGGPIGQITTNDEDGEEITVSWRVVGLETNVTPIVDSSLS